MDLRVLGLMVAGLAGVTWWLTAKRDSRPVMLWSRGWLFLFTSAALLILSDDAGWAEQLVHLLGPFFPALMLAGALTYARRRVPAWLLPLTFALGSVRCGLDLAGYEQLDHGAALIFEPGALLVAAFLAAGAARRASPPGSRYLLPPAFVAVAAVEAASALVGMGGGSLDTPELLAWAVVGPFTVLAQIRVTRESVLGRQQRAAKALVESAQRYRALTENAFDLIAELDREGRFTYVNPRYEEWFGDPTEDLIGASSIELVHPEDRERTRTWFRTQGGPNGKALLTIRVRHRSGGWRWIETSGRTFQAGEELRVVAHSRDVTARFELGERLKREYDRLEERVEERTAQLHAAVASLEDEISERRRVEHELRVSEERWRNVSQLSSDLSFALTRAPDGSLTVDWITQAVARITRRSLAEIEERGWPSVVHPEDFEQTVAQLQAIGEGETREFEARLITREGEVHWLRTRITGHRSPENGDLRVLGAASDITEARKAEEERRRLEADVQDAQKLESLGILAGGIAHDFNNALAVILGNEALAMSEAKPGSRLAKELERIRSAAKHAEALTQQMLTYSGKTSVSLKPLNLSALIEEMSELLEAAISKNCRLDISLDHGLTLVNGDPTQLRQVIMNLVINASEALRDHPGRIAVHSGLMTAGADYLEDTVGVRELAAGPYVYLEVADPGEGIDAETRARIFDPFFSTKFTGRGLGLASVLGIVRAHGGAIKLLTEPKRGTRFRVLLPPAAAAEHATGTGERAGGTAAIEPNREREERGGTILIVDDDEAVLELAHEFLVRDGLDAVTAQGGREALEILLEDEDGRIGAVVLDLAMPDIGGPETLLEIRRLRPDLPVVVTSGFGEDTSMERFGTETIAAFLRKPYEPEDLIGAVRGALSD